jgi:hypothetical protein
VWHVVLTVVRPEGKRIKRDNGGHTMNNKSDSKETRTVEITYCVE